jgi:hypothetical protein
MPVRVQRRPPASFRPVCPGTGRLTKALAALITADDALMRLNGEVERD